MCVDHRSRQFFKAKGRGGITRGAAIARAHPPLLRESRTADLSKFVKTAYDSAKALSSIFPLGGLRELEIGHLFWTDISFEFTDRACDR
jgi:hypothetical protein